MLLDANPIYEHDEESGRRKFVGFAGFNEGAVVTSFTGQKYEVYRGSLWKLDKLNIVHPLNKEGIRL